LPSHRLEGSTGGRLPSERGNGRAPSRPPGREKLLEAAATLFAESGYDGVTTRQILERAGVEAPSLYHHFGSKLGLYRAVLAENNEPFLAEFQRTSHQLWRRPGASARKRLATLVWAIFQGGVRNRDAVQIALFEAHRPGPTRFDVLAVWEGLRDGFRQAIEDGASSGELALGRSRAEVAANLLIGGLTIYMQLFVLARRRLTRSLAAELVDTLVDGLASPAERRTRRSMRPRRHEERGRHAPAASFGGGGGPAEAAARTSTIRRVKTKPGSLARTSSTR
jgi:AcrR family transcriptional regulator